MGERVAVIVNPTKFTDRTEFAGEIERQAAAAGQELLWYETSASDPGGGQVAAALADGCTLVVACGGDGTVTACAAAVVAAARPVRLAVVPVGTGNLFARNLGLPLGLAPAIEVAFGPHTRPIDVLRADDRCFLVMAGLGLDAALIRDTDDSLKARIGWLAYLGGLMRAVRRTGRLRFVVEMDAEPAVRAAGTGVLVGNVGSLQAGVELLSGAEPDDGLLDVIVLAPRTRTHWLGLAARTLLRQADRSAATVVARGRQVKITCEPAAPVEFDGEFSGEATGLTVTVLPGALTLCAPVGEASR